MIFLLLIVGVLAVLAVSIYNNLAALKIKIKEAWSQIDVQLKRRTDLIPNLVETVKGYATHEQSVFEEVNKARASLMGATNPKEAGEADKTLTGALGKLFAIAEAYPELKAQEGFINLQKELSDTEDKVAYSRQFYNSVVKDYNTQIVTVPGNIFAGLFGYKEELFFDTTSADREPVKVQF